MELHDRYIRFDWAIKRLLRNKANFGVLEGLLTVLLNKEIHIIEILESESNQRHEDDKFNRVDIKARDNEDEIIIVEVQVTRELYYLERILYGVAKAITEHIELGHIYSEVKKVYSISILYFDIGKGDDYLYHGQNSFVGVHTGDLLQITTKEKDTITRRLPSEIFPEYILIRLNEFDKVAVTPLEEWLDYLKNGHIRPDTQAPGLAEARQKLIYYNMDKAEREAYDRHVDAIMIQNDVLGTAKLEGLIEGRAEGRAEGRVEGKAEGKAEGRVEGLMEVARNLKKIGIPINTIVESTGLTIEEINNL
ncbi:MULTISPECIES: Rpn family recombination-promoting nuclease/putative transposase [Butyricimonas]|uniref:Rpn family recombination-promoting nuclease/putative transposase n=1 Tax=Butyricimonas TaxID=574697 RepID=UPI001D070DCE|nr:MULTISPECIES: Rpn family recombination-promoting nuclease/putative transposase [Butyricimonas]MCB6973438.1 Rpn family recombination-promoting nuclease/putative transposase [Butyricimonas synergistica]MCG4520091.1 Rpn family recombination-promoting nuclease/putative transposase [Butyricimonas sp. DFI.6.44]